MYWKAIFSAIATFIALNLLLTPFMHQFDAQDETGNSLSDGRFNALPTDVIFIGDSRTHQGLDPEVFAAESAKVGSPMKALNLAAPGLQGPFYYFIFKDYLEHAPAPPKAVVMNISFYMLGGAQWLQDIYLAYYTPDIAQVRDVAEHKLLLPSDAIAWYFRTRIPALRYNKSFSGLIDAFAADPLHGLPVMREAVLSSRARIMDISRRGYFSSGAKFVTEDDMKRTDYDVYKTGFELGYASYQDYFKRFFDLAAEHHVQVIIYPFPWPQKADQSKNFHNVYDYYERQIKSLAKDNPYVHFANYNYFWTLDYFVDPLHVNQKGADRLTKMAAQWVVWQSSPPAHSKP